MLTITQPLNQLLPEPMPVSSFTSLTAAVEISSPISARPPGNFHRGGYTNTAAVFL